MKTYSTQKSLYPSIALPIDGKVYQSRKMTHSVLPIFAEIEERIKDKDKTIDATIEWIVAMFGVEKTVLEKLDWREIEDIYLDASKEFRDVELQRMDKAIIGVEEQTKQLKKVQEVTKEIPSSKNLKGPDKKA